eukprot:gene30197-37322_t
MELAGVMKTLAEPTLTAISGEKATFRVGGEYNMINGSDVDDKGKITYNLGKIDYGIGLEFVPVVLSPGRISLKVRTSVSEPTMEGSVSLGVGNPLNASSIFRPRANGTSTNVISIRKRLADTTAISGLPGLSKIPVLGTLFRSREFVRNETELVIIVTPYLVRPVARSALARPDDNLNLASDAAGMFLGKVNR